MNAVSQKLDDAAIVAQLRKWIRQGKSDHWLGMQARLLIEPGRTPDNGGRLGARREGTVWVDTGSQAGYEPPGAAWERHDDPEQQL